MRHVTQHFTVSPKLPAAMLRDLAALCWLEAGESVILYGPKRGWLTLRSPSIRVCRIVHAGRV